ncbi:hypothetical protein K8Z61_05380 [Nocardioides sp. TRM66260-LWL]|uniref:hypothetical protein n=1 Tax=Nocardioides sp. TRM66260-LWL TaxID=2874478 RepID=UPI001CC678AA|nr:hypothetical protein [Nocardioides sp. TRM66260-LWL]MBZ5733921.1 hypothetical protein [Nocardioides sp. TRM66260-LWL]
MAEQPVPGRAPLEPSATGPDVCSAKGCVEPATSALQWNNPRLHTPDRRKTWLACEEHRTSLSSFLSSRGFLKDVVPFPEAAPGA